MASLSTLFDDYIKAGKYLKGWSPKTPVIYKRAFTSFQQSLQTDPHTQYGLTKAQLEAWIVWMRDRGLSPAGCNIYIRAMNAFCSWLHENGHLAERVRIKQIKAPQKQLVIFSSRQIQQILAFKPRRFTDVRLFTLVALLVDTGIRIDEALTILPEKLDFDNLLLTVAGKGNKERTIPFSLECRKVLFRYAALKRQKGLRDAYLFCTRSGLPLRYRNTYATLVLSNAAQPFETRFRLLSREFVSADADSSSGYRQAVQFAFVMLAEQELGRGQRENVEAIKNSLRQFQAETALHRELGASDTLAQI